MSLNDDEIVDLFYRLLERLQQADGENTKGSHNTIVYVATGATYVNNQHNQYPQPDPPRKREPPTGGELEQRSKRVHKSNGNKGRKSYHTTLMK